MTTDRGALAALLATMTLLTSAAGPAAAQTEQTAPVRGLEGLARPAPTTTIPIPDAPKIVLPSETPAPRRASRPRPTETQGADNAGTDKANSGKTNSVKAGSARADSERTVAGTSQSRPTRTATEPTRAPTSTEPAPIATRASEPTLQSPAEAPATETAPAQPAVSQPDVAQPAPAPVSTTQSTVTAPETGRAMPLWLSLAVIVVVLAAFWALRRKPRSRRQAQTDVVFEPAASTPEPVVPETVPRPAAAPVVAPVAPAIPAAVPAAAVAAPSFLEPRAKAPPPVAALPRARLTCELRPLRAGLNLLSATAECDLVVTNTGTAPAEAIRTGVALLTAHAGQDSDLAQFNAAPIARPVAPPFALAPGETRTIRTIVAVAREAIQTMTAANRPMFVPVVAANIIYRTAGDEAQIARAWVVGIERTDSAKLAPFWLEGPAKMFTSVAARPHATIFER